MFSLLTKEQKDKRFNNKVKTGCFYRKLPKLAY